MATNFYANVEAERARNSLTIAQVAEKLGIDERSYRDRIYKNTDLKMSQALAYAELFDCSLDYLFGRTDTVRVK